MALAQEGKKSLAAAPVTMTGIGFHELLGCFQYLIVSRSCSSEGLDCIRATAFRCRNRAFCPVRLHRQTSALPSSCKSRDVFPPSLCAQPDGTLWACLLTLRLEPKNQKQPTIQRQHKCCGV